MTGRIEHDEMKTGLISAVSHQLKTPLTSLRMALYILLDDKTGQLTSKQADLMLTARDESDRLNDIIENLLNISRLESGKDRIENRACEFGKPYSGCGQEVQERSQGQRH